MRSRDTSTLLALGTVDIGEMAEKDNTSAAAARTGNCKDASTRWNGPVVGAFVVDLYVFGIGVVLVNGVLVAAKVTSEIDSFAAMAAFDSFVVVHTKDFSLIEDDDNVRRVQSETYWDRVFAVVAAMVVQYSREESLRNLPRFSVVPPLQCPDEQ